MKFILCLSLLLVCCTWAKKTDSVAPASDSDRIILFLVLKIRKDDLHADSFIELLSKTFVRGKMKREEPPSYKTIPCLKADIYRKNRLVHTLFLEHPLYKHFEYADERGVLTTKNVELNEAEFFIRMSVQGDRIQISEIIPPAKEKALITVKL